ncbi:MAG: mycothiol system anti-sigma-R factor [Actinobacteria bacterium]|jgi:mycothiol system anti-sigma-R factor|nr:mycothiol system anti-sigma-R factor [Actinomycetota bacterium]
MADCNETLAEIWRFFDDQLSEAARADIQSHLGECTDCLQAFDFYAELKTVVAKSVHDDTIPESLRIKIFECFGPDFTDGDGSELRSES